MFLCEYSTFFYIILHMASIVENTFTTSIGLKLTEKQRKQQAYTVQIKDQGTAADSYTPA